MNQRLMAGWLAVGSALCLAAQPAPLYINTGTVTEAPQIDAIGFANFGTFAPGGGFSIFSGITVIGLANPYNTQHTLYYTNHNSGVMTGALGYEFKHLTPTNISPTDFFVNRGRIDVGTFLVVDATNIFNSGLLGAGPSGLIKLTGKDVELSRSAIRTGTPPENNLGGSGTFNHDAGEYTNPAGVTDLYWGSGENGVLSGVTQGAAPLNLSLLQMPNPRSPSHQVLVVSGLTNRVTLPISAGAQFAAYANTNRISESNYFIQAVFVRTNTAPVDTNFWVDVKFAGTSFPNADPNGRAAVVQLNFWDVDVVTGFPFTNRLYFVDRGGALTNFSLYTNSFNTNLFRPLPYEVTLTEPAEWTGGQPGNTPYANNLILDSALLAMQVTNTYIGYSASFGSTGTSGQQGIIIGGIGGLFNPFFQNTTALSDPTNRPGRIEITAERLRLNEARIRGEGLVTIKGDHFTGEAPRKIDSPLIALNLGSTNRTLRLAGAVPDSVRRFGGTIYAWTGTWTNQTQVTVPNPDPMMTEPVTNTIDIATHVLVFDFNIQTIRSVSVRDFVLRAADHIEFADRIAVSRALSIDGKSLNMRGQLLLSDQLPDLVGTNFQNVDFLTNSGTISVAGNMNLGNDRETPLVHVSNSGSLSGASIFIRSANVDHSGSMSASTGRIQIDSTAAKLDNGRITSIGDVAISGDEIKGRRSTINAGSLTTNATTRLPVYRFGKLILDPKGMLTDGGSDASNRWTVIDGFRLLSKPTSGDLLGTQITSIAAPFAEVMHQWAGDNRGADPSGYTNNAALGRLRLDGGPFGSVMNLGGVGSNSAFYVDFLEFANFSTNVTNALTIQSNLTVYFAAANLPVERLDGQFDGRLRWVRSFAGPNSGTNITLPSGVSITVNRSLRTSTSIDSDADGIVNANDPSPFDAPRIVETGLSGAEFFLRWRAAAQTAYTVEYRNAVAATNWTFLASVQNASTNSVIVTQRDPIPPNSRERYYRVSYRP